MWICCMCWMMGKIMTVFCLASIFFVYENSNTILVACINYSWGFNHSTSTVSCLIGFILPIPVNNDLLYQ